jgi:hypothetical protein
MRSKTLNEAVEVFVETLEIRVKVNGGTLIATAEKDPDYPGISICYETENGDIFDVAWAEVKSDHDNKDIDVYTYEDVKTDDYTRKCVLKHNEILEAVSEAN